MFISALGAILFGLAVGWIAYRILRSREGAAALSDLITILGVIGGAAVIALFKDGVLFGLYSLGLVIGFLAYFAIGLQLNGKKELQPWGLERIIPTPTPTPTSTPTPDISTSTPDTSTPDTSTPDTSTSDTSTSDTSTRTNFTDVRNRGRKGTSSTQ